MISFPDEIWHQIFSHYECVLSEDRWWMYGQGAQVDYSARKTLTSIALVSKQFHRVAQPLLYRIVLLEGLDGHNDRRQALLTRTLAAFPNFGLHTRTVSLMEDLTRDSDFHFILKEALPSLDLPSGIRRHMEINLEEPKHNPGVWRSIGIAVFVLALVPRVRLIDCTYLNSRALIWMVSGRVDMDEHLSRDLENEDAETEVVEVGGDPEQDGIAEGDGKEEARASFANYGLGHLEELRLRTFDCMNGTTPIHTVETALLHPNLKILRLLGSNWLQRSLKLLRWPNEPCRIELLELRESLVEAASIRHILTRFTNLRTLIIHLGDVERHDDDDAWSLMLDEFGSILRELGEGLVELSLHTNNFEDYLDGTGEYEGCLGSLVEMRSLKHLSVVAEHLVDDILQREHREEVPSLADVLPPSLETLHLHYDEQHWGNPGVYRHRCDFVNGAVRRLLEQGHMPNLRQVSIERYYNETLDGEFDGPVAGWDMTVKNVRLWVKYTRPGCERTIVTFNKQHI